MTVMAFEFMCGSHNDRGRDAGPLVVYLDDELDDPTDELLSLVSEHVSWADGVLERQLGFLEYDVDGTGAILSVAEFSDEIAEDCGLEPGDDLVATLKMLGASAVADDRQFDIVW